MAQGQLFVLSNVVSAARDAEFNKWYNDVHAKEVCALDGFLGMTRYRITEQTAPPADPPQYRYLATYDLSDIETALSNMNANMSKFNMSDSLDTSRVWVATMKETYVYKK